MWEECDDRTRGMAGRTRNTKSLGSDQETVVAYIKSLYAEREARLALKQQQKADYDSYVTSQKVKGGIVKPFEKWILKQ